jgi:hypothetical protein
MAIESLCPPAIIYIIFSFVHVIVDINNGLYNMALMKMLVAFIISIALNFLCQSGMGVVAWIIVFVPFILMTVITGLLLLVFGLNPATGRLPATPTLGPGGTAPIYNQTKAFQQNPRGQSLPYRLADDVEGGIEAVGGDIASAGKAVASTLTAGVDDINRAIQQL